MEDFERNHIGELDGIRAIAIIIIVGYHFWQLSWLRPSVGFIDLDWLIRNGSILVDMMILMSGFCLFLPYARHKVYDEEMPSTKKFYKNRFARIAPSYYLSIILILVLFVFPNREYYSKKDMWMDISTHVFFIHNWFEMPAMYSKLLGVLWTVAVEVQLYAFFPFIAKAFLKRPKTIYFLLIAIGLGSSLLISKNFGNIIQALYVNNTLTFVSVFANGMLGAYMYILMTKDKKRNTIEGLFFTIIAIGCIFLFKIMCHSRLSSSSEAKWQIDYRFLLSILNMAFIISCIMSLRPFRKIFNNRIMSFIASISYNLYIYHQFIAVKLREWKIPYWEGETLPNMVGNFDWQWKYLILCIVVSVGLATLMTYCVERPVAKLIKCRRE